MCCSEFILWRDYAYEPKSALERVRNANPNQIFSKISGTKMNTSFEKLAVLFHGVTRGLDRWRIRSFNEELNS